MNILDLEEALRPPSERVAHIFEAIAHFMTAQLPHSPLTFLPDLVYSTHFLAVMENMIIILLCLLALVFIFGFAGMAQMLRSQKQTQAKLSSNI